MRLFYFITIVWIVSATSSSAADLERQFRVVTSVGPISDLKYDSGSESTDLKIEGWMSQMYPMPEGALQLYRLVPPPPGSIAGTKPSKEVIAKFNLQPDLVRALIVLIKREDGSYAARLFDDDFEELGRGKVRLINFSSMPCAISIGEHMGNAQPGDSDVLPYVTGPTRIKVAVRGGGGGWQVAYQKGRIAYPELRAYALVFDYEHDPRLGPPTQDVPAALVRFYTEKVPMTVN